MAYLEQSTRYIAYNQRLANGQYRYFRPPELLDSPHGARFVGEMDRVFDTYGELLPLMQSFVAERFPQQAGDSDFVYRQATRAKALDALRGLLPAASLSNIGIYGTGQAYEQLLLRMRAHPLPEARHYADSMLVELRKVIPSFLQRVDVPERGGEWSSYLATTRTETARLAERLWPELSDGSASADGRDAEEPDEVTLLDYDPQGEEKVLVAIVFSSVGCSEREAARRVRLLGHDDRVALLRAVRRRAAQPPPPARARLRAHRLPLRDGHRLRRVPRPATSSHAHDGVAAARRLVGLRHADTGGGGRAGRALRRGDRPRRRAVPHPRAGLPRTGVVRRRTGAPHPLRHAVQRAARRCTS